MLNSNQLTDLSRKRILITGASGFIGTHLSERLCKMGADVHGTTREKKESNKANFTWWQGTFDDIKTATTLLLEIKPHVIFHLAGEANASNDMRFVLPTFQSILTSTVNLLIAADAIGCERILIAGSCTEPSRLQQAPSSPYAAAKQAANEYVKLFYQLYNAPVVIVRTFMGYGPGQNTGKLIPYVINTLLKNESPKLSTGKWLVDWVYIDDIIDGFIASAVTPGIEGTDLDLGTGVLHSVRDVIEKISKIINSEGKPLFGALPDRLIEETREADIETTFKKINWKASINLEDGLKRTINWYFKQLSYIRQ